MNVFYLEMVGVREALEEADKRYLISYCLGGEKNQFSPSLILNCLNTKIKSTGKCNK